MTLLQAIDDRDQLADRVNGEDGIASLVLVRRRWSIRVSPGTRKPHRRAVLQAHDELMLSPDAHSELLPFEGVMPSCDPDLLRRILEDMLSR